MKRAETMLCLIAIVNALVGTGFFLTGETLAGVICAVTFVEVLWVLKWVVQS